MALNKNLEEIRRLLANLGQDENTVFAWGTGLQVVRGPVDNAKLINPTQFADYLRSPPAGSGIGRLMQPGIKALQTQLAIDTFNMCADRESEWSTRTKVSYDNFWQLLIALIRITLGLLSLSATLLETWTGKPASGI